MTEAQTIPEGVLEVIAPDGSRRMVRVTHSPFLIGRGAETGNDLQLPDRRISRQCAAVVYTAGEFQLEDRGQRRGLFINGTKVDAQALREGDVINFGLADSFELIFHGSTGGEALPELLSRMDHVTTFETGAGGLRKLSLLLQATALLHSHLPLDAVLGSMVDHAIALTDADRGLLLDPSPQGNLRVRLARQRGGRSLPTEGLEPSQTAIRLSLEQKKSIVTEDVAQADFNIQAAQSIIAQRLRTVVVIPLYARADAGRAEAGLSGSHTLAGEQPVRGQFLGVLYLDSRRPAAFSTLERQILDALGVEAASVLDNARLVERERERQRLEQEISIARTIQQALLPREFQRCPYLQVSGINYSCQEVGGDYYDVLELGPERHAILIADVSGKGLGAALLTTMLQGAVSGMTLGHEPAGVFTHVNRFLCSHSELERYATIFFGTLDPSGNLEFINAGHPSPVLIRNGSVETPFPADCFPVGLLPDAGYKSSRFELRPGDTLVLFSDGVTEAMDPENKEFGNDRLKDALGRHSGSTVEEIQAAVLKAVQEFTRGAAQADDLTLLVTRYVGPASMGEQTDSSSKTVVPT